MNEIFTILNDLGLMGKVIVIIIFCLSIVSWAIIIEKSILLSKSGRETKKFLYVFQIYSDWKDIDQETRQFHISPLVKIFRQAIAAVRNSTLDPSISQETYDGSTIPSPQLSNLKPLIESAISTEMLNLEKRLIFLSSTITASPFLGLFGTVWGIMEAFLNIGLRGSASISVIGPGIAVALITTIVGLAVAIPVLFAYNLLVDKIRKYENQLAIFSNDLINKINVSK